MKLPSNDKNTGQEQGSLPIRAKVPTTNHQLHEWQLVGEQGNDLHDFHIHETFAFPDEQL